MSSNNIQQETSLETHQQNQPKSHLRRGILTFQQLNALALVVILSASGMVAIEDFGFVILTFFYMYFLSTVAFPAITPSQSQQPVFADNLNRLLSLYCFTGAVVGLFLPVVYIFEGIYEGDKEGIKAATPHVFLLASQLFLEGVAFSDRFSLPMKVLVPVVYNSTRLFSLLEWVRSEVTKEEGGSISSNSSSRRLFMGRVLAVVNLVYWGFNLFGFLLPFYLPRAFKRYYSDLAKNLKD
uniref:uncharacterized protein LOC122586317 n=1 Tax=Erigeron canadensis TaxID=72917 RepID=UPI001CB8A2C3|nr:uncharacterized protein LOC122586317 [Erigeron canadensis]